METLEIVGICRVATGTRMDLMDFATDLPSNAAALRPSPSAFLKRIVPGVQVAEVAEVVEEATMMTIQRLPLLQELAAFREEIA